MFYLDVNVHFITAAEVGEVASCFQQSSPGVRIEFEHLIKHSLRQCMFIKHLNKSYACTRFPLYSILLIPVSLCHGVCRETLLQLKVSFHSRSQGSQASQQVKVTTSCGFLPLRCWVSIQVAIVSTENLPCCGGRESGHY